MKHAKKKWLRVNREEAQGRGNYAHGKNSAAGPGIDKATGSKRRGLYEMQATDSDLVFSFENVSNDSVEFMMYNDVNSSCKRACVGRVEAIRGAEGSVTHVAKEMEGREEDYLEKRRESVGDGKVENIASAASDLEDRREK